MLQLITDILLVNALPKTHSQQTTTYFNRSELNDDKIHQYCVWLSRLYHFYVSQFCTFQPGPLPGLTFGLTAGS